MAEGVMVKTKQRILVVDDVDDVRSGLVHILEDEGYQVCDAPNGTKAMDMLEKEPVQLVITDVLMPEMDGMELVTRASKLYPEMKFILISGGGRQLVSDYDYLDVTSKLTGVSNILKKPFRPDDLLGMITEIFPE